jgi:Transposase DDE domain
VSNGSSNSSAFKKKLHRYRPDDSDLVLETQRTTTHCKAEPCDPRSLERGVRQLLADKINGNLVGLWLLVPEHLRLGTWDLLRAWTRGAGDRVEPRLALQLVHEAALCLTGIRQQRALSQRGFEVLNGLPFLASDRAIHTLLADHTLADAQQLQLALGKIRQASGHFAGRLLAVDPHRLRSHSQRQMRRQRYAQDRPPAKLAQTFFAIDAETQHPVCFTTGTSARTVTQATPELLHLAASILNPQPQVTLVLVDAEHFSAELLDHVHEQTRFDLLVPMPQQPSLQKQLRAIPPEAFTRHWAGYATAKLPYRFRRGRRQPFYQFVQRQGEQSQRWTFNAFLCTADRAEVPALTEDFPQRWHAEEFFNAHQDLGWDRAGTHNLHIRYGHMTMALLAQATVAQLRQRLGEPAADWDAAHLAQSIFQGLEGDIRVSGKTILVTYYNAPNAARLRELYEHLPAKLEQEQLRPGIPWLYDFKLDFRFR